MFAEEFDAPGSIVDVVVHIMVIEFLPPVVSPMQSQEHKESDHHREGDKEDGNASSAQTRDVGVLEMVPNDVLWFDCSRHTDSVSHELGSSVARQVGGIVVTEASPFGGFVHERNESRSTTNILVVW